MNSSPIRWRKRGPRFDEIAAAAGLSVATVDRVLNERGSVSPVAREKVVAAARQLGVGRVLPELQHKLVRIDLLLPLSETPFFRQLNDALQQHIQMLDRRVVVQRMLLTPNDESSIEQQILRVTPARQGLIVTAPDTPRIRAALDQVISRGEPVVTMVSDVAASQAHAYVGIDNLQAGRTAGLLLARLCRTPGRVLILHSRSNYRAHEARQRGCTEELLKTELRCEAAEETGDDPDRCYFAVIQALREAERLGPLVGIYNTGGGATGVAAALVKHGLAGKLPWIGHEASADHRRLLRDGVLDFVIDQDAPAQAVAVLQHMLHANGLLDRAPPARHPEPRLYCAANLAD